MLAPFALGPFGIARRACGRGCLLKLGYIIRGI
jgi:hypothetical protein